jgi:hypothetical protein
MSHDSDTIALIVNKVQMSHYSDMIVQMSHDSSYSNQSTNVTR